jgi:hypothetical protein
MRVRSRKDPCRREEEALGCRPPLEGINHLVKLKPPGKRTIRGLAVTGVAIAGVASLALNQTQALADPGVTYVALGADVTQDFLNGWATALGGNLVGSYNATNPQDLASLHQVITPEKTGNATPTNALPAEACGFTVYLVRSLPGGTVYPAAQCLPGPGTSRQALCRVPQPAGHRSQPSGHRPSAGEG